MAPPKSATSRSQDPRNDDSDTPATPDPNRELLQQLAEQLATANARLAALEAERQQPPADRTPKDPKLTPPPEFSGKISEYRNFIAQCTIFGSKLQGILRNQAQCPATNEISCRLLC